MKNPISLCLIVKNEPQLEQCLLSIRDYVAEIVVIDTGSTDNTFEVAQKYADICEKYTDCNDPETGLIVDFSKARQYSFDKATQPWVMWCDGDDVIEGGEHLQKYIEEFHLNKKMSDAGESKIPKIDSVTYLFPYEYAYNAEGKCIMTHYRERLFFNKNYFKWINPVHEVVEPDGIHTISFIPKDDVVFKHKRQFSDKVIEPGRNLRILKDYYEKVGDSDARQLYYLGLEYANNNQFEDSIECLIKYINISGWDDERVMACLKLVDIFFNQQKYDDALRWAFKAIEIKEDWCEGFLQLSKIFYFKALTGGVNSFKFWRKCIYFGEQGLALPATKTLLFINPLDRDLHAFFYLNKAYNELGQVEKALETINRGLAFNPDDALLLKNKTLYEEFLAIKKVNESLETLKQIRKLPDNSLKKINDLINKVEEPAPVKQLNINCLDIVFYIGNGVEVWTPETVASTGIGGSELMALEMAKRLAKLGHQVSVYNSCGSKEGTMMVCSIF